jgi:CCR4-NOT transcriptional regulation complex NOT5 subunit
MKQTAVDYLFKKLWGIHKDKFTWQMILIEAKKKEKKQIVDAYDSGMCEGFDLGFKKDYETDQTGQMFYKETYEKK